MTLTGRTLIVDCLSTRAVRRLRALGLSTLGDVAEHSPSCICCLPSLGRVTFREIAAALEAAGLQFRRGFPCPGGNHRSIEDIAEDLRRGLW